MGRFAGDGRLVDAGHAFDDLAVAGDDLARDNLDEIAPEWMRLAAPTYFNTRKVTIYGGSNEIQRNIIAKAILGL